MPNKKDPKGEKDPKEQKEEGFLDRAYSGLMGKKDDKDKDEKKS